MTQLKHVFLHNLRKQSTVLYNDSCVNLEQRASMTLFGVAKIRSDWIIQNLNAVGKLSF